MKKIIAVVICFIILSGFPVTTQTKALETESHTEHTYTDSYIFDGTHHWRKCSDCDIKRDYAEHTFAHGICVFCKCNEQRKFPDVNYNAWYTSSVEYVSGKSLISGYGNGRFGTADSIMRQDFIVILSRLSGDDLKEYTYTYNFYDVPYKSYYYLATGWSYAVNVSNGYADGRFGVGDKVTREQIMCFLYNYASYKGYNTKAKKSQAEIEETYPDYKNVSSYAKKAVVWAISNGIISGKVTDKGTLIDPKAYAKRCEIAAMFFNIANKGLFETKIKYPSNSSGYNYKEGIVGGAGAEAMTIKKRVLTSANTEDIYNITGKKYYVSRDTAFKDIPKNLQAGDALLFERGGLWRVPYKETITLPEGVIMGSYGKGEKPKFYGSQKNYAKNSLWTKVDGSDYIYKTPMKGGNAGNIVFNNTACLGVKKWSRADLAENYDFYYSSNTLYLYYKGNLEKDFDSIEISQRGELVAMSSNSVVDNICVKYTGSIGIINAYYGVDNTTITNCEIGYIGGSMQFETTRFGNGIQFGIGATDVTVKNNYIYECYDAGFTFQTWSSSGQETHYYNIDFSENLIEKCAYGIEYFTTNTESSSGLYSDYKNINIKNNIIRFSGYEWSQLQRPDPWMTSHIRGGQWAYMDDCEDFTISDNIFDISKASIIFWWWNDPSKGVYHPEEHKGLTVKNNTFYQAKTPDTRCMTYHTNSPVYAVNAQQFRDAVLLFDSQPAKTVWYTSV